LDCKTVKDKLLDYIDGSLNKEEKKQVKEHLTECRECYEEYMELKSTINYIVDKSNKIDTRKELNLNPHSFKKKSARRFKRTGLIAAILSLILAVCVFATDIFDFISWWKKSSERQISAWEKLIENGVGQKLNISITDNNIRVTAEGVIADDINTIILLKIEDLNGNTRFVPEFRSDSSQLEVGGDITQPYEGKALPIPAIYSTLYTEKENTVRIMVYTHPMNKEEGEVKIYLNELVSYINKSEEDVVSVKGNWNMTIPAKKIKSKVYDVGKTIDLDGNKLIIDKIILAPTSTKIKYRYETYNKEKRYFIKYISFLIKDGLKTYGESLLSSANYREYKEFGISEGEYDIESLYLEDPKDIDLIVDTYRYTTRELKTYHIDWNNLPQVIEYDNSKITIEDIKYNKDSTEIIIKEDDSRDRKYMYSNIYLKINEIVKKVDNDYGVEYPVNRNYWFYGEPIESEIKGKKGKVKEENIDVWTDDLYPFYIRQKITLSKEQFKRYEMNEENFEKYLIPGLLYIEGQEYIEYPNIKINIKLDK